MKDLSANNIHKRSTSLIFRGKAGLLQLKRGFENLFDKTLKRHPFSDKLQNQAIIAESKTLLWTESEPAEQFLLAGKIHNLRLAVKNLNGLEIPAGEIFSFWNHLGQANRRRGFVFGRELREGCIIPNIGGGLCQISNALYDAALQAGLEIIERHAHTQVIPGSLAEKGRDATVFWNYVDLRFRSQKDFRIETFLGKDHLTVRFRGKKQPEKQFFQIAKFKTENKEPSDHPNSCATCGVESCFRSLKPETKHDFGKTAFLVDEFSPEFDEYIHQVKNEKDILFIPLDGRRFKKANYAWNINGFSRTKQSLWVTAIRSYKSRKLAAQGAARQINLLAMYEKLAKSYAKSLSYDILHLVVAQNLLPFLWREGVLGGRTFDVLMTALPMKNLQERLDLAFSLHPESKTLADFRADKSLLAAEAEALKNAEKIITPHTEIASIFGDKAELLDWKLPKKREIERKQREKLTIVFPASTVGRKGCYELREAVRDLNIKVVTLGATLEEADFWQEIDWENGGDDWLNIADLVVFPAFVEHKPRRLLQAVAHNIPVIASAACGVENVKGIIIIKFGESDLLKSEIEKQDRKRRELTENSAKVFLA